MTRNFQTEKSTNAPIIVLLGSSTAGKTTICDEIFKQNQQLPKEKQTNFEVWGHDLEIDNDQVRLSRIFKDDPIFQKMQQFIADKQFPSVDQLFGNMDGGRVKDRESGGLILDLKDDEKFKENIDDFLAKTNGRYGKEALETLKDFTQKELKNGFREKAGFTMEGLNSRMFDHVIENSKNGVTTILDVVPAPNQKEGEGVVKLLKQHLASHNFDCPTKVAMIHVPLPELAERMNERNRKALAPGGNPANQRDGTFPLEQYGNIFGAKNEKYAALEDEKLARTDVHEAIYQFARNDKGEKVFDLENQTEAALATIKAAKGLINKLGFKNGEDSITLGSKVEADVIFDHTKMSNAQIASKVRELAMPKEVELAKSESFVEKYAEQGLKRPDSFTEMIKAREAQNQNPDKGHLL